MKKSTIGVLGIGEVGSAISAIFKSKFTVLKKDLNFDEIKNKKIEVLHICIPYSEKFISIVTSLIKTNNPKLVIIHSTVRPTTTSQIFNISNISIVHSPVMGSHPNLRRDILRFTKFVGPVNQKSAKLAQKHFTKIGIKVVILNNSLEAEIGKLLDTTYYAWNIIFCKLTGELCQEFKVDFTKVYNKFNKIYNLGYKKTKPNVIRPILKFEKGAIGGTCLISNAKILNDFKS